jgi:methylated-DNA-[protein]-cysteine S-methyltransferase
VRFSAVIDTPPGRLAITTDKEFLLGIAYVDRRTALQGPATELARDAVEQLQRYFSDPTFRFNLPLHTAGTAHQQKVWRQLQTIEPGETMTYGELATSIGSGARAVGNSCRHNPISIVIPCHRVVAANGIGGYGGHVDGKVLDRKYWLLRHEQAGLENTQ